MPHIEIGQVWKFGIAKAKEALARVHPAQALARRHRGAGAVSAFNPAAWIRRLENLGGGVIRQKDGSWMVCMPIEHNFDEVRSLTAEINPPEHALAVRQYVSGRP